MTFLGKNIRYLRKAMAKTQTELASMIGKGQTTIGNWENGISEPSLEELVQLSRYFGTSIDQLLTSNLSLTGTGDHPPVQEKKYAYEQGPASTMAGEEKLEYLIKEVRKMRDEIDQIKKGS